MKKKKRLKAPNVMDFGEALRVLKTGGFVARRGWNGKGMYLYLDSDSDPNDGVFTLPPHYEPYLVMFTAQKKYQPGWLASQADMLADDWIIIERYARVRPAGRRR